MTADFEGEEEEVEAAAKYVAAAEAEAEVTSGVGLERTAAGALQKVRAFASY